MRTYSYGGKLPSTNMEVRRKKLEVRNKKCRACIDERTHMRTIIWTHEHARGQTDGRPHARVHANTRTHALMNAGLYDQTFGRTNMYADRQAVRRTDGRTHIYAITHALAHTRTVECLHAHTMHSGTYARTESHTHTRSYTQVQTWKLEVRSKKLEVRNKKCRACIDERTHVRTNIWTPEHARGQTDGRTDSNIRPHARVQANTRMHALMNAGLYDQTGRTDGLTQTPSRTNDALMYIRRDGQTYAHMFVRRQTPKYKYGS